MALAMNRVTLALLLLVVAAAVFVLVPQDDDEVAVHSISCSPAASDAALGLSWGRPAQTFITLLRNLAWRSPLLFLLLLLLLLLARIHI